MVDLFANLDREIDVNITIIKALYHKNSNYERIITGESGLLNYKNLSSLWA